MSKNTESLLRGSNTPPLGIILMVSLVIYVGTRPLWCYTDSGLYSRIFRMVQSGEWNNLAQNPSEWFFSFIEWTCIKLTDAHGWFFVIACFYILGMCFAAWRCIPKHFTMAVMFLFTAFSFWSYSNNGIRQGMGASLVMAGIACITPEYSKNWTKYLPAIILIILGCACHNSLYISFFAIIIWILKPEIKTAFTIWCVCLLLSPFSSNFIPIAGSLIDDHRMGSYGSYEASADVFRRTGWRWDFILYSAMPVILAYYAIYKRHFNDFKFNTILNVYLITNALWMLINAIPYSNRFAYVSWSLYPLVLCMPLAKFNLFKSQGVAAGMILFACVIFNLIF